MDVKKIIPSTTETWLLKQEIGKSVLGLRTKFGISGADLAAACNLSHGMLSKIENGKISASLGTLQSLSDALGVPITSFLRVPYNENNATLGKASESLKDVASDHRYRQYLKPRTKPGVALVEPDVVTIERAEDVQPGLLCEQPCFIHVMAGEMHYRHGDDLYHMQKGDSLMIRCDTGHGLEEALHFPLTYLSVGILL